MSMPRSETAKARPLEILGIGETEERAYRWLLVHPGTNVSEIARGLALAPAKAQQLLDAIEAKGLATHTPERPRRYVPASPDISIEALILQRQNDLQRARSLVQELQEQAAAAQQHEAPEQMIELITSREAERHIHEQMTRTAQQEIVALVRPPMRISQSEEPPELDHATQREAQARGVRCRSIVDSEFLALPGALTTVRSDAMAGEEVRVSPHLPSKLVLADRRIALIPLNLQQPDSPALLVRSSALLDALYALFDILWERAAPIAFTPTSQIDVGSPDALLHEEDENLVSLMAAGLNDKKIAGDLRISDRTLRRRVAELMKRLDARTRFQAGWLAASRVYEQRSG